MTFIKKPACHFWKLDARDFRKAALRQVQQDRRSNRVRRRVEIRDTEDAEITASMAARIFYSEVQAAPWDSNKNAFSEEEEL
jgi:hypothetical protein